MQRIPIAKPAMDDEMVEAAVNALRNERMVMGESVFRFEEEFARYIGTDHAVSVASGTAALQLALIALNVSGNEVLTTPFSFIATANVAIEAGAIPKFADAARNDYNIDPAKVTSAMGQKTAALMPVHLFGQPARMDELLDICRRRKIPLVEDAAQAHGASYKGKKAGALGELGCFSFYPTKNMTVAGDGGMVTTNDEKLAKEVAKLRDCGRVSRYLHDRVGYTSRLNTCNAAVGRVQLKHLDAWNERRRELAARYARKLSSVAGVLTPPVPDSSVVPVFHQYVIQAERRDALVADLERNGVDTAVHYPVPIHLQPVYRDMYGYQEGDFPVSEALALSVLSLPVHPALRDQDVDHVCECIARFYGER